MYCKNCGKEIERDSAFCPHCGTKVCVQTQQPVVNVINNNTNVNTAFGYIHKKKWTAFWLCLLLGELGIHRFYVGKTFTGILWLCTFGLGGVGWLFDLLVILLGGFKDKAGQPLI